MRTNPSIFVETARIHAPPNRQQVSMVKTENAALEELSGGNQLEMANNTLAAQY
jgi:hypothetical protein